MEIVDKIIMVHLVVRDMDKAKAFYTDVLGFEATGDTKWDGAQCSSFPQAAAHISPSTPCLMKLSPELERCFFQHQMLKQHIRRLKQRASS